MLLHNPTAGASHPNAEALLEGIHKAIGVKPSYFSIKNADWKDALSKRWDAVILAGGDGTVGKSVRRLRDRKTPIAILPLGTANNIARSLGIEGDLRISAVEATHCLGTLSRCWLRHRPLGKENVSGSIGGGFNRRGCFPEWTTAAQAHSNSIWRVRICRNS